MAIRSFLAMASALALTGCGAAWDCDAVERELARHEQLLEPLVADLAVSVDGANNCDSGAYGYTVATMKPDITIEDVVTRLRRAGWTTGEPDANGIPVKRC